MGLVTKPFHLEPGNTARASELNDNFDAIIAQVNGNIQEVNLANGAVTENKIGDGEVKTAKIGDLQVTTAKLGDGQVTTDKIDDLQVTDAKVAAGVNATKIGAGNVTNTEFGYLDGVVASIQNQLNIRVPVSRTITAGDGLSGGGTLSADRKFDVDSTVVRTSRTLTAGSGLTGGGTLAGDRQFAVDSTVVRTSREISAGTGLSGGGTLGADRELYISNLGVGTAQLANGAVTNTKIGQGEVTADKLSTGSSEGTWVRYNYGTGYPTTTARGSLMFAAAAGTTIYNYGDTILGSSLTPANTSSTTGGTSPGGSWKCLGYCASGSAGRITLWVRIA